MIAALVFFQVHGSSYVDLKEFYTQEDYDRWFELNADRLSFCKVMWNENG